LRRRGTDGTATATHAEPVHGDTGKSFGARDYPLLVRALARRRAFPSGRTVPWRMRGASAFQSVTTLSRAVPPGSNMSTPAPTVRGPRGSPRRRQCARRSRLSRREDDGLRRAEAPRLQRRDRAPGDVSSFHYFKSPGDMLADVDASGLVPS
jgi:hypothetical protein